MKLGVTEDDSSSAGRVGPVYCARRTKDEARTAFEAEFWMGIFGFAVFHLEAASRAMLHAEFAATALALHYFDVIPCGRDHFDEVFQFRP